jgi:hypothetical protein
MAASNIPPIDVRFALRERDGGTCVCIVRTARRWYNFELCDPGGQWLRLNFHSENSEANALERVDRLARLGGDAWEHARTQARPSPLSREAA